MPDFVTERLRRPAAIAINLAFVRIAKRLLEVGARLFTGPALVVDSGIDDQASGTEGDRIEISETTGREVVIQAELIAQLLRVKRPAFRIGVER